MGFLFGLAVFLVTCTRLQSACHGTPWRHWHTGPQRYLYNIFDIMLALQNIRNAWQHCWILILRLSFVLLEEKQYIKMPGLNWLFHMSAHLPFCQLTTQHIFFFLTRERWNKAGSHWAVRLVVACIALHVSISPSLWPPPFTALMWKTSHNCWSVQSDPSLTVFFPLRSGLNMHILSPGRDQQ